MVLAHGPHKKTQLPATQCNAHTRIQYMYVYYIDICVYIYGNTLSRAMEKLPWPLAGRTQQASPHIKKYPELLNKPRFVWFLTLPKGMGLGAESIKCGGNSLVPSERRQNHVGKFGRIWPEPSSDSSEQFESRSFWGILNRSV